MSQRAHSISAFATAAIMASALCAPCHAAFVSYSVVATCITNSGQSLMRYEVFANFNGPTDTVLNVFNFQASGGWAAHTDAATGFWHKDLTGDSPGLLSQQFGTWAPTLTGSATLNRPFDSFLLIGGTPASTNTTTSDPAWNGGGANPAGWSMAQIPLYNDLGWFNASPQNLQGRVGTAPNTATQVKLGQFIISQGDTAFRTYTLRIAINNATVSNPVFSDGSFTLSGQGILWYRDLDGDGFGAVASGTLTQCAQPVGYVLSNTDCNDANAAINPSTVWNSDLDSDGFGAVGDGTLTQCTQPAGYVLNNTDNCPSIANPFQTDCNANGIGDVCDIATGGFADCDSDSILDICEGAVIFTASSPLLSPFGSGFPAAYTFANLPKAYRGTPTLTIEAISDLSSSTEFIAIAFDGGAAEYFFVADGTDCPPSADVTTRTFTLPALNALINDGALALQITASGTVDAAQCVGGGIRVRLNYEGLPASSDCNNNNILDSCEIGIGAALDCNGNGVPDSCDVASGFASDCNGNAKPDNCDIATGPSTDLNTNGIPDECSVEFVVGGSGYSTISAAVSAAPSGATIHIAPGMYNTATLVTSKQVHLRSIAGPATTILSGGGLTTSILAFTSNASIGSTVRGFTLRDGIVGYEFVGYLVGGAIACINSSILIDDCIFEHNHSGLGGAIYSFDGATQITNSSFTANSAGYDGGAIQIGMGSGWLIADCTFTDNFARGGGAMHVWSTTGTIRACGFSENSAIELGGALSYYTIDSKTVLLDGCTLVANSANEGGGIYQWLNQTGPSGALNLLNTTLCNNAPDNISGPFNDLGGTIVSQDCNNDGVCDADEIAAGSEFDCNGNGFPDSCDLLAGTAVDCNNNSVPDTCDIASGTSTDIDSNGVPDDCKPDCDADGLPDAWELLQGLDRDCNNNQLPDSCEIASGAEDKNSNTHLDSCELARGDLNLDGIVNAADLAVLLSFWGWVNPPMGDLTGDGLIGAADLSVLLSNWGSTP
jgi:hypothetical protein